MRIYLFIAGLIALQAVGSASNIVQNPGFEDITGAAPWVYNGWGLDTVHANTGFNGFGTGCLGTVCLSPSPDPVGSWVYQDLVTTAGTSYNLSFFLGLRGNNGGTTPNEIKVLWNGTEVFDVKDLTLIAYTQYSTTVVATSTVTRLEFLGYNDPNVSNLDDVSVDQLSGVPEPSSWLMIGSGIAGFALRLRSGK